MSKLVKNPESTSVAEHSAVALSEGLQDFGIETGLTAEVQQLQLSEWIGQRKFSAALQKLLTVSDLVELQKMKETKSYRGLRVIVDGKLLTVSSFAQICDSIGVSEQHVSEQLLNLSTFGPEFLAFADQSLGYRDMRALRKLPDDEKSALIEAAKSGDKDQLLDLAESLMVKHAKEKQERDEEIQTLNSEIVNHRKHYGKIEAEFKAKAAEVRLLTQQQRPGSYHPVTVSIRAESAAMEFGARIHLDELEGLYEAALNTDAPSQMEKELRVHAVALAVSASFARSEALYARLRDELGEVMPIQADGMLQLGIEEKQKLKGSVAMQQDAFEEGKSKRQVDRQVEDIHKGRGRPAGSKNKKD